MKRLFIGLLIFLLAGTYLGQLMVKDPGYVLVAYDGTTIETSLWILLVILVIGFVVLHALLNARHTAKSPVASLSRWSERRRQRKNEHKTLKGLSALSEGTWWKAQRFLTQAADSGDQPLLYVAAAQAAHSQNHAEEADQLLQKVRDAVPQSQVAVGIMQARMQYDRGEYDKALANLLDLKSRAPKHAHLLTLLKDVYVQMEKWTELNELLNTLNKLDIITGERLKRLEILCAHHLLDDSQSLLPATADTQQKLNALVRAWQTVSASSRTQPEVMLHYIRLMQAMGQEAEAEKQLRHMIQDNWDERLVEAYGRVKGSDLAKQLSVAENWKNKEPESAALELTLGRLALQNKQWQNAVSHFERSTQLNASAAAFGELSRILQQLGEEKRAEAALARAFQLSNGALPQLPMPKADA